VDVTDDSIDSPGSKREDRIDHAASDHDPITHQDSEGSPAPALEGSSADNSGSDQCARVNEDRSTVEPARRGEAIQPLTTKVLIERSLEFSSYGFITIISIIQGVALGLLAQKTFEKPSMLVGIRSATLLLVFVAVFYFYMTLSILLRWAPSFLDAFLPFAIGSIEISPAFFLDDAAAWSAWLAAFWLFTSFGILMGTTNSNRIRRPSVGNHFVLRQSFFGR
jgi:hypothetical protein